MNRRVLVAYATKRGSTREVAQSVAETLRAEGFEVECRRAIQGYNHTPTPRTTGPEQQAGRSSHHRGQGSSPFCCPLLTEGFASRS